MFESNIPIHQQEYWIQHGIEDEIEFKASLSGGKGGQNVNKVNSKAEIYWNPSTSNLLSEEQKIVILSKLQRLISAEGTIRVSCDEERSLVRNKSKAVKKLCLLLSHCFKIKKARKPTKPTATSLQKKRQSKENRKKIKSNRIKPSRSNDD